MLTLTSKVFGNAALTFHLLEGLDLKTQFGVDAHINKDRDYTPSDLLNLGYDQQGEARMYNKDILYWQEETYLTYMKNWGKHRLNAMAGLSWQQRTVRDNETKVQGFADNFFGFDNLEAGSNPQAPN